MDRPRSKGEKTKALIAEKAKVIFEQKGYVGTSMEDIREFSEISKGSIYYHFKSKEELFLYTVEKTSEIWRTGWEEHSKKVETSTENFIFWRNTMLLTCSCHCHMSWLNILLPKIRTTKRWTTYAASSSPGTMCSIKLLMKE